MRVNPYMSLLLGQVEVFLAKRAGRARWKRKSKHDLWAGEERSTKPQIVFYAQRAMVVQPVRLTSDRDGD
jgi:hypothetical protein